MTSARWIDGHLDLAYVALCGEDITVASPDERARCVSLPALRAAGVDLILATVYTAPGDEGPEGYRDHDDIDGAEAAGRRQLAVYEQLAAAGAIGLEGVTDTPVSPHVVVLMEGAGPIRGPEAVDWWAARGVRLVGLTWARGTRYAGGNASGGGLTAAGRELVDALDAAGVVHDASHLSDAAFDDLVAHTSECIVATHSNVRALVDDDERHLRDDQIKVIAERDGIVGLNLYARFLHRGRRATIDDAVRHVEHVAAVMGHRRGVGLGSDMDGGFPPTDLPEGLTHPRHLEALATALAAAGWTEDEVNGFRYANWQRVVDRCRRGDRVGRSCSSPKPSSPSPDRSALT